MRKNTYNSIVKRQIWIILLENEARHLFPFIFFFASHFQAIWTLFFCLLFFFPEHAKNQSIFSNELNEHTQATCIWPEGAKRIFTSKWNWIECATKWICINKISIIISIIRSRNPFSVFPDSRNAQRATSARLKHVPTRKVRVLNRFNEFAILSGDFTWLADYKSRETWSLSVFNRIEQKKKWRKKKRNKYPSAQHTMRLLISW